MWQWLGRLFRPGTEEDDDPSEEIDLDLEERFARLSERVQRIDERTRKQRYREAGADGADVAAPQERTPADSHAARAELMRAFRASRGMSA